MLPGGLEGAEFESTITGKSERSRMTAILQYLSGFCIKLIRFCTDASLLLKICFPLSMALLCGLQ